MGVMARHLTFQIRMQTSGLILQAVRCAVETNFDFACAPVDYSRTPINIKVRKFDTCLINCTLC